MSDRLLHHSRTLFGRRKGKTLSTKRIKVVDRFLPDLRLPVAINNGVLLDPQYLFTTLKTDLWMEIGFGSGEHLAWQAQTHADIGFIGAEPFFNGVASMVRYVDELALKNVRIWDGDARVVLRALPDNSLGRVFALFQDPWPKTRHAYRRIINRELLDSLARIMRSGSQFRWATDHPVFLRWSLNQCLNHDQFKWDVRSLSDWSSRPDDWPETRYEAKATRKDRISRYFTFLRV